MARNITNFKKHGYFHGITEYPPGDAIRIFCRRRTDDVIKDFGDHLSHYDLIARIYYQGLRDGEAIWGGHDQ